ncbi:hypothetical protein BSKO_05380 [Bryopsis sp. KO-2023]|nr:hypothetical protein BSKO_05380 [Bryopsis sp. KO-2023]
MVSLSLYSGSVHRIGGTGARRGKLPTYPSRLSGFSRTHRGPGRSRGGRWLIGGVLRAANDADAGLPSEELVTGPSISHVVDDLTDRIIKRCSSIQNGNKWIIGIAGPPGGGKTLLANAVCERVNEVHNEETTDSSFAAVVPMDGFHYTKAQLDAMSDPALARAKRGAHWTFDGSGFVDALERIRTAGTKMDVFLPSFDHGVGDPIENDICVSKSTQVVLVEGNYLFLDIDPWTKVPDKLDEKWFASCPLEVAAERVYRRHLETGKPEKEARERIQGNDGPNAELVDKTRCFADIVIDMDLPLK